MNTNLIKEKILEIYKLWEGDYRSFSRLQNLAKEYVFNKYSHEIEINEFRNFIFYIMK
jgi:hypothetical protein